MSLLEIKEKAIDILKAVKDMENFSEMDTCDFVRQTYTSQGPQTYSTWKILLDKSKTKMAVRDAQGFKIINLNATTQIVNAPVGTKDLILNGNKADKELAYGILNGLAFKKYESEST